MAPPGAWNKKANLSWTRKTEPQIGRSSGDEIRRVHGSGKIHPTNSRPFKHQHRPTNMSIKRAAERHLIPQIAPGGSEQKTTAPGEIWVRITIIYGAQLPDEWLKQAISEALGVQTKLYNPYCELRNKTGYFKMRSKQLNDFRAAMSKLTNPTSNSTLSFDVSTVPEPGLPTVDGPVNDALLPTEWSINLQVCIVSRFQQNARTLDLSNLHNDHELLSVGLFLPMNKSIVVNTVCKLLSENQAHFSSLNLSNNRLVNMDSFKYLVNQRIVIEHLDLSMNPLNGLNALSALKNLNGIVSLDISETPIMTRLRFSMNALMAQLRITFPNLTKLNGRDATSNVQMAGSSSNNNKLVEQTPMVPLPESKNGYFPSEDLQPSIISFIKNYFDIFDGEQRGENLICIYSQEALFSFCLAPQQFHVMPQFQSARVFLEGKEQNYCLGRFQDTQFTSSRNLARCKDEKRRENLLLRGPLAICAFLNTLRKTEHLLTSFSVDVAIRTSNVIVLVLTGLYYEVDDSATNNMTKKVLRSFTRTMYVTAPDSKIIQDDWTILNPNMEMCKEYITGKKAAILGTSSSETIAQPVAMTSSSNGSSFPVNSSFDIKPVTQEQRNAFLQAFQQHTGMNMEFTRQCLEEYQWDMNRAKSAFKIMKEANQIPPDAFV